MENGQVGAMARRTRGARVHRLPDFWPRAHV